MLIVFVLIGALAGASKGSLTGAIGGAMAMLMFIGPLWCVGCVYRAREYQEKNKC